MLRAFVTLAMACFGFVVGAYVAFRFDTADLMADPGTRHFLTMGALGATVCGAVGYIALRPRATAPIPPRRLAEGEEEEVPHAPIRYMPCPYCGKQIADQATLCGHCWQKIVPLGSRLLRPSSAPEDRTSLLRPAVEATSEQELLLREADRPTD